LSGSLDAREAESTGLVETIDACCTVRHDVSSIPVPISIRGADERRALVGVALIVDRRENSQFPYLYYGEEHLTSLAYPVH